MKLGFGCVHSHLVDCSVNTSTNCVSTDNLRIVRSRRGEAADERTQTVWLHGEGCGSSALGAGRPRWARAAARGPACASVVGLGPGRTDRGHRALDWRRADELMVFVAPLPAAGCRGDL